jgi:hypothetical protein
VMAEVFVCCFAKTAWNHRETHTTNWLSTRYKKLSLDILSVLDSLAWVIFQHPLSSTFSSP